MGVMVREREGMGEEEEGIAYKQRVELRISWSKADAHCDRRSLEGGLD